MSINSVVVKLSRGLSIIIIVFRANYKGFNPFNNKEEAIIIKI